MRQIHVHLIDRRLHHIRIDAAGDQRAKIAASIADDHHLLHARHILRDLVFDGFGRNIVTRFRIIRFLMRPLMRQFPFEFTSP